LGIGDLGLAAEYMERGLYDDPNREFSASATYPLGDGRISGEFRRNINPNPRQQDETYVGGKVTIPFQEGGIASLPNNPVLAGQQHMLAYITPEEASTLRAQGGGVTPTGGQYRGPGGIASFGVGKGYSGATFSGAMGQTPGATGDPGHPKSMAVQQAQQQAVADSAPPAPDAPASVDISSMMTPPKTPKLNMALSIAENNAEPSIAAMNKHNLPQMYAQLSKMNPKSTAYASLQGKISKATTAAVADGFSSGAISKMNQVAHMNVEDFMGNVTLALTLGDQEFTAFDIANMSDAEFSALSANPATGVKGDPKSPLGMAVLGLSKPLMTMLAPPLSLPMTGLSAIYGFANPDEPSFGLMGLAEQALGTTLGEVAGDVSEAIGLGRTPLSDLSEAIGLDAVTGYIGDQFSSTDSAPPALDAGAVQGQDAVYGGQPSNLGPGISLPLPAGIPSVEIGLQVPPTASEVLTGPLPHYTAEQLATQTGVTVAQAQQYLDSLLT
jgi:hypothetical protein